jgi:hypothetical protein
MSSAEYRPAPAAPQASYWPSWASAMLLLGGIVVIAAETTSWLVVLGVGFLCLGAYGFLFRRPGRVSRPIG